jgi:hypothetical protein
VGLVVVNNKFVPLIAALPFSAIEPAANPLPKLIVVVLEEVTVKPLTIEALCPSVSVTTILCPPSTAFCAIESVAVIFEDEL